MNDTITVERAVKSNSGYDRVYLYQDRKVKHLGRALAANEYFLHFANGERLRVPPETKLEVLVPLAVHEARTVECQPRFTAPDGSRWLVVWSEGL